ncbi:MAG: protein-L-isoaspartate O-methyltransferase [Pseudomonadota bacterium]
MNFEAARRHMVISQVRPNDVTDLRIQKAMAETPRELFLPAELRDQAYIEREVRYAPDRWLLRARDFAKLINGAEIRPGDIVLNAVCGAGYSTAILAQLAEMVVSIENDADMAAAAQENLTTLGFSNAAVLNGDPIKGAEGQGPFDVIFIGGAIEKRPEALLNQLVDGGRLATFMREDGVSRGGVFRRSGDAFAFTPLFDAATTAVLPGFTAEKTFAF